MLACYPDIQFVHNDRDFWTIECVKRRMLSRDGLHLSFKGTETLVRRIEMENQRLLSTKTTTVHPVPVLKKTTREGDPDD